MLRLGAPHPPQGAFGTCPEEWDPVGEMGGQTRFVGGARRLRAGAGLGKRGWRELWRPQ